jgi:hypothetical protein
VLVVPFYAFVVCLVVEASLILVVKLGTIYAAYAAARSQVVWRSAQPDLADEAAQLSALHAMVPFASSSPLHARGGGGGLSDTYIQAYQKYTFGKAGSGYLAAKYAQAAAATRVDVRADDGHPDGDITAIVTYEMPLHVIGIGRLLGDRNAGGYFTRTITSQITLQNDAPVSEDGTLGINYVSR